MFINGLAPLRMNLIGDRAYLMVLMSGLLVGSLMFMMSVRAHASDWPIQFENADGTMTHIPAAPKRIVSTSVTLTGSLLAIHAPVVASATTTQGTFFEQWDQVAKQRGVDPLWPAGHVDIEAVYAMAPDLIVVAWSGADSTRDQLATWRQIAPTVVIDYGGQTWQSLARQLGQVSGLAQQAEHQIHAFDQGLKSCRQQLKLPTGQANIISYNGPGAPNPIARPGSVHAQLLAALGFSIEGPDPAWQPSGFELNDFVRAEYEHLTQMQAATTFLLSATDKRADAFMHDPVLANLPSVKARQVYGLGAHSFRIDFFSAQDVIQRIVQRFGQGDKHCLQSLELPL